MSSDLRLERLGLAHLKDQPARLREELQRRVAEGQNFEEEVVQREMEEIRRSLGIEEPRLGSGSADQGAVGRSGQRRSRTGLRTKGSAQR